MAWSWVSATLLTKTPSSPDSTVPNMVYIQSNNPQAATPYKKCKRTPSSSESESHKIHPSSDESTDTHSRSHECKDSATCNSRSPPSSGVSSSRLIMAVWRGTRRRRRGWIGGLSSLKSAGKSQLIRICGSRLRCLCARVSRMRRWAGGVRMGLGLVRWMTLLLGCRLSGGRDRKWRLNKVKSGLFVDSGYEGFVSSRFRMGCAMVCGMTDYLLFRIHVSLYLIHFYHPLTSFLCLGSFIVMIESTMATCTCFMSRVVAFLLVLSFPTCMCILKYRLAEVEAMARLAQTEKKKYIYIIPIFKGWN